MHERGERCRGEHEGCPGLERRVDQFAQLGLNSRSRSKRAEQRFVVHRAEEHEMTVGEPPQDGSVLVVGNFVSDTDGQSAHRHEVHEGQSNRVERSDERALE